MGSYSVDQHIRHVKGDPGWGPTLQFSASGVWWVSFSIIQLWMLAGGERKAMVTCDSAVSSCFRGCSTFSTGISNHRLLPHIPSIHLSTVNSSPLPGIVPQTLSSSSQPLFFQGTCVLVRAIYGWSKDCLIPFPFSVLHRPALSLPALNVSPLSQTIAPMWVSDPFFSSPTHWVQF